MSDDDEASTSRKSPTSRRTGGRRKPPCSRISSWTIKAGGNRWTRADPALPIVPLEEGEVVALRLVAQVKARDEKPNARGEAYRC